MRAATMGARAAGIAQFAILSCTARATLAQAPAESTQDPADLEDVVVTGTHIHGADAAGSKLIVISRDQIDASGYSRIEDVMATVTQNFNRANAAVRSGDDVDNYNRGAEVQLRGLGIGTTLTLVNGQRQGAAGFQGSFIDVSSVPAAAVERIEILPEGASALYGSDAIGGVVNVIFRKDFEGFEARARVGSADGDATERTFAGLWGHAGSNGHLMLGLQYDDSRALDCSARVRCAANGNFVRFGGSDLRGFGSNPGTILDLDTGAPKAAIPRGQDGTNLTASQLIPGAVNYTNSVIDNDIVPEQVMRGAFFNAAHSLSSQWELSVDGRYSSRDFRSSSPQLAGEYWVPAENAFNHLGGLQRIAYDFTSDIGPVVDSGRTKTAFISTGLKGELSREWQVRLSAAYSKASAEYIQTDLLDTEAVDAALADADPATALNIFGDGSHTNPETLAALRYNYRGLNMFTTSMGSVIADGPLHTGLAGPIRVAIGADVRREHSDGLNIADAPENRRRNAVAGFFELAVPLVAAPAGSTLDRLALSLAGRYDRYSDAGSSFNPKVGLSWRPFRALGLRGNWGTSFRPPPFIWSNPDQVGDGRIEEVFDPKSRTGRSLALELFGPLKDLKPETSTAWSLGADVAPPMAPNLSLSLTYFDVDYKGKVRNVGTDSSDFLTAEAQLASLITRNPSQAQIDAICNGIRLVPSSTGQCSDRIVVILDARFRNLARLKTRGVDFNLDYAVDSAKGRWALGLNGTHTFIQKQQITTTAPLFDFIDTVGNPLKLRLAGHLSWSLQGWTVQTTVNHTGAYRDPVVAPARGVDSWTTVDLNLGYRLDGGHGWLAGTRCNLGAINLFDRSPSFVDRFNPEEGTFGYDAANASLAGRLVSLQIVKRWGQ